VSPIQGDVWGAVWQETAGRDDLIGLKDEEQRAAAREFLCESRQDVGAGRTEPAEDALERLAKKHKLNREGE
jgi:hypothetical protein